MFLCECLYDLIFLFSVPLGPSYLWHSVKAPEHSIHCAILSWMHLENNGFWRYGKYSKITNMLRRRQLHWITGFLFCHSCRPIELLSWHMEHIWFYHRTWQHHWNCGRFTGGNISYQLLLGRNISITTVISVSWWKKWEVVSIWSYLKFLIWESIISDHNIKG